MPIKCTIGGVDVSSALKGLSAQPGGDGLIGQGTLVLDQLAGGMDLRPYMEVRVWQTFDAVGNGVAAKGRLFGGLVATRTTSNHGTTKTWSLRCSDYNLLLHRIVRDAASTKSITLTAGTFGAQMIQLTTIIQQNGLGSVNTQIDATTGVASLYPTMPGVTYEGGHSYGWYIQQLCNTAQSLNSALNPHFYMGTTTTFGVGDTFGTPVLYVFNGASLPAIGLSFSDVVAGGRKGYFNIFKRTTDATQTIQRKQAFFSTAHLIATSGNATSQSTYPNPFINHGGASNTGYWMDEVTEDRNSTTFAAAQAELDRQIAVSSIPGDSFEFDTEERVLPGDMIGLGNSLEGIADDTPYRVVKVTTTVLAAEVINSHLTVNSRRLGLFDNGQAVFAPPVEGDIAPLPPASASITSNTYDWPTARAAVAFSIGPSPSPNAVGYAIIGRVGHEQVSADVGTDLTPTLYLQPGLTYDLQVFAYNRARRYSEGTPAVSLTGTTAAIPPVLAAPGSLTETSNQYSDVMDLSQVSWSWTAPADPNSLGIAGYKCIVTQNSVARTFLIGASLNVNLLLEPSIAYTFSVNAIDGHGRDGTAATMSGTAAARVHDILLNPSFENIARVPQPINPLGWTLDNGTGTGSQVLWDNSTASEGTYSIKFVHPNAGTVPSAYSDFFRLDPLRTYAVDADVKGSANDATGPAYDFEFYLVPSGSPVSTASGFFSPLTTSWMQVHGEGGRVPPPTARYARIKLKFGGTARVLDQRIDNIRVRSEVPAVDIKDGAVGNAQLGIITDSSKIQLWADTGTPRTIRDNTGVIRGDESATPTVVRYRGINTGGSSPINIDIESSTGDGLFLPGNGADVLLTSTHSATMQAGATGTAQVIGNSGASSLRVGPNGAIVIGAFGLESVSTKTATFTADAAAAVYICNSASAITANLPTAVGITGRIYVFKQINTGKVTIDGNGSQTIDGITTFPLSEKYQEVAIISDGANWLIIGQSGLILESDGTRWLGPAQTWRMYRSAGLNPTGFTTNQTPWMRDTPNSKDSYWIERISWRVRVDTTSSIANYWTLRFGHESNTLGGAVDLDLTTAALTAGTNDTVEGTSFSSNPLDFTTTGVYTMFLELVKTGTPGQLNIWGVTLMVRRVYT